MADAESQRCVSALLNGIAQKCYYGNEEITEEFLKNELYSQMTDEEFRALHDRMRAMLKSMASADMDQAQLEAFLAAQTRRQAGGVSAEQAAALSRFWKTHRARVRDSLLAQSRWEPGLRNLKWRVDLQMSASRGQESSGAVAVVELELGRVGQTSEFVCVEVDEQKVNQVLKKMQELQRSIDSITQPS